VFNNLGVHIKEDELISLFHEIDQDRSGSIDIDEYIYFIQKNSSGLSAKATAAVLNIKGARRISLHDLRDIFTAMPSNFVLSFIAHQNKQGLNLPSSALRPRLDPSGFFY
jgi:Ca2+-binding EF-hand superfamily protein